MNPLTLEWIEKAEGDFGTAQRELSAAAPRNYDAVCFHAQQCAEKYLKAALQERMIAFPKTHDLAVLIDLLVSHMPEIESWRAAAKRLSEHAVEFRYPVSGRTNQPPRRGWPIAALFAAKYDVTWASRATEQFQKAHKQLVAESPFSTRKRIRANCRKTVANWRTRRVDAEWVDCSSSGAVERG